MNEDLHEDFDLGLGELLPEDEPDQPVFDEAFDDRDVDDELQALAARVQAARFSGA